jgi:peptidoglycan biosynthesis protein MviN/MurJ (putative lipid II flippase)
MSFVPGIIVNVIYERGKYTSADRIISSNCLQLLTIGFVSKVLYISLARVLYIIKRQKEIIFITLIPLIAKFIGNIMFINKFEVYTIAATTSLANILMLWLLVFKLNTPKFPVWSIVGEMKIISIYILLTVLPAAKFFL